MVAATPKHSAKTPEVNLLVLHSDHRVRHLVSESTPQDHFKISFADQPDQFEECLEGAGPFDAILIRLTEPVETASDLISRVKVRCPQALIVVLCSASEKHRCTEIRRHGVYEILAYPVDGIELKRVLFNILERARHG